jgi:UDP-N-acetylmuramoyl-tripeptide--D-alanyl-D-alanine ligase
MGHLQLDDILKATGGEILCLAQKDFSGLSIDSRTIKKGELFVPLKGPHFDGHNFLRQALQAGAGALVNRPGAKPVDGKTIIGVENTLGALQGIARHLRFKMEVPVIGITGTNGKTTTKELISSILGRKQKVLKTYGNLNNHIGLPLCLSRMEGDETVMILEMGSNAPGDIELLCEIARPDFAVITNVGPAHLEGFGSLKMVRKTDLEILGYVKAVAVNADDTFLVQGLQGFSGKIRRYGMENTSDVYAADIALSRRGSRFRLRFSDGRETWINLSLAGRFNIYNALAAAAIADEIGVSPDDITKGLESFQGVPMRLEIVELFGALVISDVYNANPASMEEALKELVRLKRRRTIAVLGDMLELGEYTEDAHTDLIRRMSELGVEIFIAVGREMTKASHGFRGTSYQANDSDSARSILLSICKDGDTVLVKGSRGMYMEKVLVANSATVTREGNSFV